MRLTSLLRLAVLVALIGMLTMNGSTFAAAPTGTVTVWVGSWWETQVPIAMQLWAKG